MSSSSSSSIIRLLLYEVTNTHSGQQWLSRATRSSLTISTRLLCSSNKVNKALTAATKWDTATTERSPNESGREFISETPVGLHETSIKEDLTNFTIRHGNERRKKKKEEKKGKKRRSKCTHQKYKQNHTHFENKRETGKTTRNQRKEDH